jgi:hypothetical protein
LPNGGVIEKHDVFGDGVNIAARLEQIAPPGGLCLSEDAYRQVPVMLPPGCDRPATRSVAHRITHEPMTTRIDVVACYAARAAIVDMAMVTSPLRRTSSALSVKREGSPDATARALLRLVPMISPSLTYLPPGAQMRRPTVSAW